MGLTSYMSILLPKHSRIISHDGENDYDSAGQAALPPDGSPAVVTEATRHQQVERSTVGLPSSLPQTSYCCHRCCCCSRDPMPSTGQEGKQSEMEVVVSLSPFLFIVLEKKNVQVIFPFASLKKKRYWLPPRLHRETWLKTTGCILIETGSKG